MGNIIILKKSIINFLSKDKLDENYIVHEQKKYTKRMIIEEIENDTEIGNKFVNDIIILSIDLFDRKKEKLNNFENISKTKLSLEIIESFNLKKINIRPDYDDNGYEFTLPSGIKVVGFYILNNTPCEMDSLEGLDGYLYIETKEELEYWISLSLEDSFKVIKEKYPEFDIDKYY